MIGLLPCTALLTSLAAPPSFDATSEAPAVARYASLPIRNLTGDMEAVPAILNLCRGALEARGASFVPGEELEVVLRSRRIRYTDSISASAALDIGERTGARFILLGTLFRFERKPFPRISLALRVVDATNGRRVQSALVTLRGEDFEGLLGLGVIEDMDVLLQEVLVRLLDMFDDDGTPRSDHFGKGPRGRRVPASSMSRFVQADFDPRALQKLGVLPLTNRTNLLGIGLVFSEIFAHECFRSAGIQIIEQSELRAAMVRQRIRSVEGLDLDVLRTIGRDLGTRYFALGSVDRYREATFIRGDRFPEIEAFVRIIDVREGRIVASVGVHRTGFDYEGLLGLGDVGDAEALAVRVASEIIAAIGIGK